MDEKPDLSKEEFRLKIIQEVVKLVEIDARENYLEWSLDQINEAIKDFSSFVFEGKIE